MFIPYTDPKRQLYNASQKENSIIDLNTETNNIIFKGYQKYILNIPNKQIETTTKKSLNYLDMLNSIDFKNKTISDVGCSNGLISFYLYLYKNPLFIYSIDHDEQCIENLINIKLKYNLNNFVPMNIKFNDFNIQSDIVISLSTIHWLYSATESFGCLNEILKKFSSITKEFLILEWVDNNDNAIKSFNHINFNKDIHKSKYNKENFISAINNNFTNFKLIGYSTKTREVYLCQK